MKNYEKLIGHKLPDGRVTVSPHESWLANDAMYAPPPQDDTLHPMFLYFAALRGMGMSLEEFFSLFDATANDGPMLGELEIDQEASMNHGNEYVVQTQVLDVSRKTGVRTATMDLVTLRFVIQSDDGIVVGECKATFIFPRSL